MSGLATALLVLSLVPGLARGADHKEPTPGVMAYELERAPQVDGEVLRDAAWNGVQPATDFQQSRPDDGQPASQRTEVFIGYTPVALYVGVIAYDSDPSSIIVSEGRRDTALDDVDSFKLVLDTFHDRKNGFVFGTNAAGVEYDAQVTNEADYAIGGSLNVNWDTNWLVESRIFDNGWSAEFEIPWGSLRFYGSDKQLWGVNFQRNIGRRNEIDYWSPVPRQFNLYAVSHAGVVTGLKVPSNRMFAITPYILGNATDSGAAAGSLNGDWGVDLKASITPSLTLDATYNTDFAQVEADEQLVSLDRFSVFLPEKRPFFLENAGIFSVGNANDVELFFSRRIGIAPNGSRVPIDGGLRLSGRMGDATDIGLLYMRSQAAPGSVPRNDYFVARARQDLPNHSSVGALFVQRNGDGSDLFPDSAGVNRTYAVDGTWGGFGNLTLGGWVAKTYTPGRHGRDTAYAVKSNYQSHDWLASLNYTEVGSDFNPEVGFLARHDFRRGEANLMRRFRPENRFNLYELRPRVAYEGYWDFSGFHESGLVRVDLQSEWRNGLQLWAGVHYSHEGLLEPFDITKGVTVPAGIYDHQFIEVRVITPPSASLSADIRTQIGGFFGGSRVHVTPSVKYRLSDSFTSELSIDYNDVRLPVTNGNFNLTLARLRLSYFFTTKIGLQAFLQYNNRTNALATNLRFSWLRSANSGLFVAYNEVRGSGAQGSSLDRELLVKYSRIFDLVN